MKSPRSPQMFITSLHMRHWRNFRGPVDMRLLPDRTERLREVQRAGRPAVPAGYRGTRLEGGSPFAWWNGRDPYPAGKNASWPQACGAGRHGRCPISVSTAKRAISSSERDVTPSFHLKTSPSNWKATARDALFISGLQYRRCTRSRTDEVSYAHACAGRQRIVWLTARRCSG